MNHTQSDTDTIGAVNASVSNMWSDVPSGSEAQKDARTSLAPLSPQEALTALLATPPDD